MLNKNNLLLGVDEAGRGPLAGAVFAAAVVLAPQQKIAGVRDSKKLSAMQRQQLLPVIQQRAYAWSIAKVSPQKIDEINILQASLLAMQQAILQINVQVKKVLVDGLNCPQITLPCQAIVKGDDKHVCIAAASILAKYYRDLEMNYWHRLYPQYAFNRHKGYATKQHLLALKQFGACAIHRHSFSPVSNAIKRGLAQPK